MQSTGPKGSRYGAHLGGLLEVDLESSWKSLGGVLEVDLELSWRYKLFGIVGFSKGIHFFV